MSILINKTTRVICQGITGKAGSFHTKQCLNYGTQIVAGVTPGSGGKKIHDVPVFNSVREAVQETQIDASMIFVPAPQALSAIFEALECGIRLIVCITEGMPVHDMIKAKYAASNHGALLIGPNCPGIIIPDECKIGIMPGYIHKKGRIGVISRSGTLTYEAVWQITQADLGQSACIGIGGDPVTGLSFVDCLKFFESDPGTDAILLIGEIGGSQEEESARFINKSFRKKTAAFIAGASAPAEKRMGHAGAIISGSSGTAQEKKNVLKAAGVHIIENASCIGTSMRKLIA